MQAPTAAPLPRPSTPAAQSAPAPSQGLQTSALAANQIPEPAAPAHTASAPDYDADAEALIQRMEQLTLERFQQRFAEHGVFEVLPIQPGFQVPNRRHLELSDEGTMEFYEEGEKANQFLESHTCTTGAAIRFEAAIAGKRPEEIQVLEQTMLKAYRAELARQRAHTRTR